MVLPGTVFIVEDSKPVRNSLQYLISTAGFAAEVYSSAEEFLAGFDPDRPGCIVLDMRLGGMSGLELQDLLNERHVGLPVIVITAYGDVETSVRAMKGGAVDFLQKPFPPETLLDRVRAAIGRDRRRRVIEAEQAGVNERLASLTAREREVADMLAEGKSSKEIATDLDLSVRTVEGHRAQVLLKMQVRSVANLVRLLSSIQSAT